LREIDFMNDAGRKKFRSLHTALPAA